MLKIMALRKDGSKVLLETWHNPDMLMDYLDRKLRSGEFADYEVI